MMNEFYPKVKDINPRIAFDLGLLYIYRELTKENNKEELLRFWEKNSPPKTIQLPMGEFHYRPFMDFVQLDQIMNGLYIERVLEQLSKFDQLSFLESCAILFDLERYFVVPLSEMDVKIIKTIRKCLIQNRPYSNKILSQKLDVRANYISRRISYLRNNAYFRVTGTVNFPRIGLTQYLVLIESALDFQASLSQYFESPFTRTIRRCPNQRFNYIISLILPKKLENQLFDYLIKLNERGHIRRFCCDEVVSISNNLSFDYYSYMKRPSVLSAEQPGFFVDWFKERVLSLADHKNDIKGSFHHFILEGDRVNLSIIDLKVLTYFRRDLDSSVRYIANRLDLSWDEANSRISKIKSLLFPMILLYYTGLNQTALFFFEKITPQQLHSLEASLIRMPQVFSYSLKNGGAIITIDLMNGAHRLNDLICETKPDITGGQFSLLSKSSGIFRPIPYQYYSEDSNNWRFPEDFFLFKEIK
ncbi:MAG: hypothetical protein GF308_15485 [Candidatus Heimdallarchaeota archaeon]|nr:hypothetical protein [Candidatus Heimdallarchaeota archaeon]